MALKHTRKAYSLYFKEPVQRSPEDQAAHIREIASVYGNEAFIEHINEQMKEYADVAIQHPQDIDQLRVMRGVTVCMTEFFNTLEAKKDEFENQSGPKEVRDPYSAI